VVGKKSSYDQDGIVRRLKERGLDFQGAGTAKLRRERLEYCSSSLTFDYEEVYCEANDLFYRVMNYLQT
jgi:hypothetical protein